MKTFEYTQLFIKDENDINELENKLKEMGQHGWELCSIAQDYPDNVNFYKLSLMGIYFFKKEIVS